MDTSVIYRQSGNFGNFSIRIKGLDYLLRYLKETDPKLNKALRKGLKAASTNPVLSDAKRRASSIADDGTFAGSLSVASRRAGASYVLKSTDPAAGVKEFAHIGAVTISSKGTPRANARLAKHSRVGVPRRAYAPRAMVPAVNENINQIKAQIDQTLAQVLDSYHG